MIIIRTLNWIQHRRRVMATSVTRAQSTDCRQWLYPTTMIMVNLNHFVFLVEFFFFWFLLHSCISKFPVAFRIDPIEICWLWLKKKSSKERSANRMMKKVEQAYLDSIYILCVRTFFHTVSILKSILRLSKNYSQFE